MQHTAPHAQSLLPARGERGVGNGMEGKRLVGSVQRGGWVGARGCSLKLLTLNPFALRGSRSTQTCKQCTVRYVQEKIIAMPLPCRSFLLVNGVSLLPVSLFYW